MFDRFMKVIRNKPITIEGTVFTKDFMSRSSEIIELENIRESADEVYKNFIESDINKLTYSTIAEENVYNTLLKQSTVPMICLHNVRIEYKDNLAKIDFVIITTKYIYVIKCLGVEGTINITNKGEFYKVIRNSSRKVLQRERVNSPILKNEKNITVLSDLLKDKLEFKTRLKRIKPLVVVANPNTNVNKKYAPKDYRDSIIRYDELVEYINTLEQDKKVDWVFIEDDIMKISDCMKEHNENIYINYENKYSIK